MPVPTVNGVAFGGPNMDILFVTSTAKHYFNYFDASIPIGTPVDNDLAGSAFIIKGLCTKGCAKKRIKSSL